MTTKERPWYQLWKPLPDFDAQTFTDDLAHIKRFYEAHGYYNAHINYDLTLNKDKVAAHINISEGKPIRVVTIETKVANRSPPPQQLDRSFRLPLKKGDVFDQDTYQTGAQDLLNLYTTHSYAHAKVQRHAVVEVGSLRARVRYDLQPGHRCVFGNTKIAGIKKVDPELIEDQLTYKSGEPFDSRKLAASRTAIVGLKLFNAVDIEQEDRRMARNHLRSRRRCMLCARWQSSTLYETSPLQRRLRDLHAAAQHAAGQQRQYVSAGKLLLSSSFASSKIVGDSLPMAQPHIH